jgi:hypothetical protein
MRYQDLTMAIMKMAVYWVLVSCSVVYVYRRFRGAYCFHNKADNLIALMMEAASTSETLADF